MNRILFCADGTWNGPADAQNAGDVDSNELDCKLPEYVTNVRKLFESLAGGITPGTARTPTDQEKSFADGEERQITKYLHGVGDSNNLAVKLLGGTLGWGIVSRIVRGYTFLSRSYEGPKDEIHIAGFSRGAYTARALGGMVAGIGLLDPSRYDPDDREKAYRLGIAAWHRWRQSCVARAAVRKPGLLKVYQELADDAREAIGRALLSDDLLRPDVPIRSIAVWDTVGSLGVPLYAKDGRIDLFRFADTQLSPKVASGFHALSIDEQREDFPVTRWTPRDGVREVWFPGAHADVGGGLVSSGLSDIALAWMSRQLGSVGVRFARTPPSAADLARVGDAMDEPWKSPPFSLLLKRARDPQPSDLFHAGVRARWELPLRPAYRPTPLQGPGWPGIESLTIDP